MPDINSPQFWQEIYRQGRAGWDLGGPTPVFVRLLRNHYLTPGRIIVLGAGRGHDARLFARHGFRVTAVDFAPEAIREMQARNDPEAPVAVIHDDIFDLHPLLYGIFDYVLEYTFFCAIDPGRREAYAEVVDKLLKPGGRYVALAFPIGEREGGPPFAVNPDQLIRSLLERGFTLQRRETPPDSVPQRQGIEELLILQKE